MADFDSPAYEPEDETFIDDQAPLLPDTSGAEELPSVPNEPADTLKNDRAREDFYEFLRENGWDQDPGDIDQNALIEHGATIHKDRNTGKVYVRYRGKDVMLTKTRGSGFAKPSTIASNARKHARLTSQP